MKFRRNLDRKKIRSNLDKFRQNLDRISDFHVTNSDLLDEI